MNGQKMSDDEVRIEELHREFIEANEKSRYAFLETNMAPELNLVWYNVNKSNYFGVEHIVNLWKKLGSLAKGKDAVCESRDDVITVVGDMALVTYLLHFAKDYGPEGRFDLQARGTEVWQRISGKWKMIHFHCSEYVPGIMDGK